MPHSLVRAISQSPSRSVLSGQDSRHHRLHQTAGVAAAVTAHETANGIAGGVETGDRLLVLVQYLSASIHQDAAHGEGDAGNDSQAVERRAQRLRLACARNL